MGLNGHEPIDGLRIEPKVTTRPIREPNVGDSPLPHKAQHSLIRDLEDVGHLPRSQCLLVHEFSRLRGGAGSRSPPTMPSCRCGSFGRHVKERGVVRASAAADRGASVRKGV